MSDVVADRPRSLRLLIILLIGLPCMDMCMHVMLRERLIKSEEFSIGLMIGQIAFLGVLAGGTGCAWVRNLLLSILLAMGVGLAMLTWTLGRSPDEFADPALWIVGCTPPLIFCCALPFLLARALTGYRLDLQPSAVGGSIKMEDFFLTTGVCAAMLVTVPAALAAIGDPGVGIAVLMAIAGGVVVGVSLLIILPSTVAYFVLKNNVVRLLVLASLCIGAPMLVVFVLSISGAIRLSGTTFLEEFAPPLATAAGCFAMCLVVLRAAGFRWYKDKKSVESASIDPLTDEVPPAKVSSARWHNRAATVIFVLASAGYVVFCKSLEEQREATSERLTAIDQIWSSQGGGVLRSRYTIYNFSAPPQSRLEDIEFLLRSNELSSITAPHTPITNASLTKLGSVRNLQTLNLSYTIIGDEGLRHLKKAKSLNTINLAFTQVTVAGLHEFLKDRERIHTLNLSGLGLTDNDVAKLPLSSIPRLYLSRNPLTPAALPYLRHVYTLDLSHTQLDGADLTQLESTNLHLNHTSINDQQIRALVESHSKLDGLSLRDTQVTDASLPYLKKISYLTLGKGPITPDALAASEIATLANWSNQVNHLALNDKKFDGSLFATRKWSIAHLDLRGSSVSDRDIGHLANVKGLSVIDVRGCNISDASLPFLASLSISSIDLTDTQVTGDAAWQYLEKVSVYISDSQCSETTLQEAGKTGRWRVGDFIDEPLE